MKRFITTLAMLSFCFMAMAESYVPREGEVKFKMLQTTENRAIHEVRNSPFTKHYYNPDGNYVVCLVAKNIPNKRQTLQIKYRGEYMLVSLPLNTWSMTTILIEK